jgi:hypothetical protein
MNDILTILRDVLIVGYLFVLRIGVPILITLLIGVWLQKWLQEPQASAEPTRADLKTGAHCWEIKNCSETQRAQCAAAQRPDLPCWLALQVSGPGLIG